MAEEQDEFEEKYFIWERKRSRLIDLRGQDFLVSFDRYKDFVVLMVKVSNDELNLLMLAEEWDYFYEKIKKCSRSIAQVDSRNKKARKYKRKSGTIQQINLMTDEQKKRKRTEFIGQYPKKETKKK